MFYTHPGSQRQKIKEKALVHSTCVMLNQVEKYRSDILLLQIGKIVSKVGPEKIFLFGVCHQQASFERVFTEKAFSSQTVDAVDLLVLTGPADNRKADEVQDVIEHGCRVAVPVTAYVMPVSRFNKWLMAGHPFACKIHSTGSLCFDAGNFPVPEPGEYDPALVQSELRQSYEWHCKIAREFFSGAELFAVRKNYALAMFNLHQAAEQAYMGIIHFRTGLKTSTHNLDKLYRYSRTLLDGLADIFPMNIEQEKRMFRRLQRAYLDARYPSDFQIKAFEFEELRERIKKLLHLCQNLRQSTPITS